MIFIQYVLPICISENCRQQRPGQVDGHVKIWRGAQGMAVTNQVANLVKVEEF